MRQYFIATDSLTKILIEGEPVDVKGFEEFKFFVHRNPSDEDEDMADWNFSEESTGLALYRGAWRKEIAIERGINILKEKGIEKVRTVIQKALKDQEAWAKPDPVWKLLSSYGAILLESEFKDFEIGLVQALNDKGFCIKLIEEVNKDAQIIGNMAAHFDVDPLDFLDLNKITTTHGNSLP